MKRNELDAVNYDSTMKAFMKTAKKDRKIKAKILELSNELDEVRYQLQNVRGVCLDPKLGASGTPDVLETDKMKFRLYEQQDDLLYRLDCYSRIDYWVEEILSRSKEPRLPFVIEATLLSGANGCYSKQEDIANECNLTQAAFTGILRTFIENNVTEDDVERLNNIINTLFDEDLRFLNLVAKD